MLYMYDIHLQQVFTITMCSSFCIGIFWNIAGWTDVQRNFRNHALSWASFLRLTQRLRYRYLWPGILIIFFKNNSDLQVTYSRLSQKLGNAMTVKDRRMKTDRCARLCAIAIVNKLDEAWISINPVLLSLYAIQYTPSLFRRYCTHKHI